MSAPDIDVAEQFLPAAVAALRTGDFDPVVALLAPDVESVTPVHTRNGVEALTEELRLARPAESLDIELESGDWKALGNGRYSCEVRALYRTKLTGELSYSRDRSFELTIRNGKVSRCEMRFDG